MISFYDTSTLPTQDMLDAIARAPLGDDVYGLDPTVNELEAVAAGLMGMLGGGMRQAGIIAAAGLVALRTGIGRLREDHEQARSLAHKLATLPGLVVSPAETNFVMIDAAGWGIGAGRLAAELEARGIAASSRPPSTVRFVTHRLIGEAEADALVAALREISGR